MRRRPRHKAFVLLLTLVLIALGVISIAGMARLSLRSAADISLREENQRRRWLLDSTRRVIGAHASMLLSEDDRGSVASREITFDSAVSRIEVLIADESAKVNLIRFLRATPKPQRQRLIRQYLGATAQIDDTVWESGRRIGLEDLLGSASGESNTAYPRRLRSVNTRATQWGDGRLNVHTAHDEVLRSYLAPSVGASAVDRLVAARADNPSSTVEQLVAQEENAETRRVIASLLRNDSDAISIWCEAFPSDGVGRVVMSLDVFDSSISIVAREW